MDQPTSSTTTPLTNHLEPNTAIHTSSSSLDLTSGSSLEPTNLAFLLESFKLTPFRHRKINNRIKTLLHEHLDNKLWRQDLDFLDPTVKSNLNYIRIILRNEFPELVDQSLTRHFQNTTLNTWIKECASCMKRTWVDLDDSAVSGELRKEVEEMEKTERQGREEAKAAEDAEDMRITEQKIVEIIAKHLAEDKLEDGVGTVSGTLEAKSDGEMQDEQGLD